MFGSTPTVIVIDEIAKYLRQLASSEINQLARATIASLKVLFEAATAADELIGTADRLERAPIKLADLDAVPEHDSELQPAMTLSDLQNALLNIPWCRDHLAPHPDHSHAWLLSLDGTDHPVTFAPAACQATTELSLLTWGNPLLDRLLAQAP